MSSKQKDTNKLNPADGNVEQIREILFGGHIRAFDERFDLVEARLSKENTTLQKALEKRLLELEGMLKEYREEAGDQLGSESSNRDLALNKIELALASARMDADNQMAQMQDDFREDVKALRSELNAAQKALVSALNKAEKAQDKRAEKLDQDKVNRKELSKFLSEMAEKIQPAKKIQGK